jgi:hypothetical protein
MSIFALPLEADPIEHGGFAAPAPRNNPTQPAPNSARVFYTADIQLAATYQGSFPDK